MVRLEIMFFLRLRYGIEMYQRIEHLIEKKLPLFETEKAEVVLLMDRVEEAKRLAKMVCLLLCFLSLTTIS